MQRLLKRPVSPHVFEIDGKSMHYKMPINAISSITNRATGVALTTGDTLNRQLAGVTLTTIVCISVPFYLNSDKPHVQELEQLEPLRWWEIFLLQLMPSPRHILHLCIQQKL